jgi:GNAT superfamily N-acetyltransferase
VDSDEIAIVPLRSNDERAWLSQLWDRQWGGQEMVTRGVLYRLGDLDAIIARRGDMPIGAMTYRFQDYQFEVMSLDAVEPGRGIGSMLLAELEAIAHRVGISRIWLITTNDNVDALRFYQRRGFRLAHLHKGAVDQARILKPSISEVGNYGIPIHDELELEKLLQTDHASDT